MPPFHDLFMLLVALLPEAVPPMYVVDRFPSWSQLFGATFGAASVEVSLVGAILVR